jgi:putative glycosyltransferase
MMAALAESRGRRVFLADCDLEEPPELMERFWAELEADPELDLVYGYQKRRRGSWLDRVLGRGYYTDLDLVSPVRVPANTVTARLATRVYVDALLAHGEEPISFDALSALTGCWQKGVEVVGIARDCSGGRRRAPGPAGRAGARPARGPTRRLRG